MESRCRICNNRAMREVVASAVLAGERPIDILNLYGETMGFSPSSLYRHVRHMAPSKVTPDWIDGTTTVGDVIADLAALRVSLIEQRAAALERGQYAVANSTAQRIESVSVSLIREAHVSDESIATDIETAGLIEIGMLAATRARPDFAREHAAGLRAVRRDPVARDLAHELDALADGVEQRNHQKENHHV